MASMTGEGATWKYMDGQMFTKKSGVGLSTRRNEG